MPESMGSQVKPQVTFSEAMQKVGRAVNVTKDEEEIKTGLFDLLHGKAYEEVLLENGPAYIFKVRNDAGREEVIILHSYENFKDPGYSKSYAALFDEMVMKNLETSDWPLPQRALGHILNHTKSDGSVPLKAYLKALAE